MSTVLAHRPSHHPSGVVHYPRLWSLGKGPLATSAKKTRREGVFFREKRQERRERERVGVSSRGRLVGGRLVPPLPAPS